MLFCLPHVLPVPTADRALSVPPPIFFFFCENYRHLMVKIKLKVRRGWLLNMGTKDPYRRKSKKRINIMDGWINKVLLLLLWWQKTALESTVCTVCTVCLLKIFQSYSVLELCLSVLIYMAQRESWKYKVVCSWWLFTSDIKVVVPLKCLFKTFDGYILIFFPQDKLIEVIALNV